MRSRKLGPSLHDLRRLLAEKYRASAARAVPFSEESPYCEPYTAKAAALEAGEPLVVAGWEVAGWMQGALRGRGDEMFRLEPDGVLVRVRAVHEGDTVVYVDA